MLLRLISFDLFLEILLAFFLHDMLDNELVVVLLVILDTLSARYYLRNWYCSCVKQSVFLDLLGLFSLLRLLFLTFYRLVLLRNRCYIARREHFSEKLLLAKVQFLLHLVSQEILVGIHLASTFSADYGLPDLGIILDSCRFLSFKRALLSC